MSAGLVVDLFAGGGGASLGIERAFGRSPDVAVNHSPHAIAVHARNHPETTHHATDVWEVDPVAATDGKPVSLLWASPDCRHFSRAKGGVPVSKQVRSLAWVVVDWAAAVAPRLIVLENVPEFQTWGPIDEATNLPDKARKGEDFAAFVGQLRALGYDVDWRILNAADYGTPTNRKRLFLIARRDGQPIRWPIPSHGPKREKPWLTAASCIDWSIPCPSIFDRKKPLAEKTLWRIAEGIRRFVLEDPAPFIVKMKGEAHSAAIEAPIPTVTSLGPGLGLCTPYLARTAHHRTRNGKPRAGGSHSFDAPLPTVVGSNDVAVVAPVLVGVGGRAGQSPPTPGDAPLGTITGKGDRAVVAATLIQTGYGEREGQAARVPGIGKPLGTVVADGQKHALVAAMLAKHYGGVVGHGVERQIGSITAVDHHSLVAATLVANNTNNAPRRVTDPLGAVTTGDRHYLVASFLSKFHSGDFGRASRNHDVREPARTIDASNRFGLVTVTLDGEEYVVVDIGLRMLQPRELARAQGFPDAYELFGPKDAQVRLIGNSVCPPVAEAVLRANAGGHGEDGFAQLELFADAIDASQRIAARAAAGGAK